MACNINLSIIVKIVFNPLKTRNWVVRSIVTYLKNCMVALKVIAILTVSN